MIIIKNIDVIIINVLLLKSIVCFVLTVLMFFGIILMGRICLYASMEEII